MAKPWLFEIWMSSGSGMRPGPKFSKLTDALHHVERHIGEASFAIKLPNGTWFETSDHEVIFARHSGSRA